MISVQKFAFDANFSIPDESGNIELYDIRMARDQGEKDGYDKGYVAGYSDASQKLEKLLNHVLKDMQNLNEKFTVEQKTMENEIIQTSFVMIQKLFPYFMTQGGFTEIQKVVEKALAERDDEKVYTIYVNDNALEPLKHKVNEIARESLTSGMVMLKEDHKLSDTDCRIEWKSGGLERLIDRLNQEIKAAVTRLIPESQLNAKIDSLDGDGRVTTIETEKEGTGGANVDG